MKPEPTDPEEMEDQQLFSHLQTQIERCKEELKELRSRLRPVKKRLVKSMQEEGLVAMRCGEFLLTKEEADDSTKLVYNEKTVTAFFDDEALEAYEADPNNRKPVRKRPRFVVERQIVDVDSE